MNSTQHHRIKPALWFWLALTTLIFLSLAFWQFQKGVVRSHFEQLATATQEYNSFASALQQWQQEPRQVNDRKLQIQGRFETSRIYHDNRVHAAQAGYAVYAPFRLNSPTPAQTTHILVNLGWLPANLAARNQIAQIDVSTAPLPITIKLEHIEPGVFSLDTVGPVALDTDRYLVQTLAIATLGQQLNLNLAPFVGRLSTSITEPALVPLDQPLLNRGISAAKHFGYAIQWIIFWLIAVGVFTYTQVLRPRKNGDNNKARHKATTKSSQ